MPARAPDPGAPYYQDDAVTIYHGDCREILPRLERGSCALMFTSPPYDDARTYGALSVDDSHVLSDEAELDYEGTLA